MSLFNYMSEIVNIDSIKINRVLSSGDTNEVPKKIKSYSVCVSISDIKRLFDMIKLCKSELLIENNNDKLIKRIERI